MEPERDFDLLAAALRADMADMATWVATLSAKLAQALPARTRLHHAGMFGGGRVVGVEADLGDWRYGLRLEHGQPVAERTHVVRGIALKTERLALDTWIDEISAALANLAATSAREREAIMRLLT
jgi:hypothetical protein